MTIGPKVIQCSLPMCDHKLTLVNVYLVVHKFNAENQNLMSCFFVEIVQQPERFLSASFYGVVTLMYLMMSTFIFWMIAKSLLASLLLTSLYIYILQECCQPQLGLQYFSINCKWCWCLSAPLLLPQWDCSINVFSSWPINHLLSPSYSCPYLYRLHQPIVNTLLQQCTLLEVKVRAKVILSKSFSWIGSGTYKHKEEAPESSRRSQALDHLDLSFSNWYVKN